MGAPGGRRRPGGDVDRGPCRVWTAGRDRSTARSVSGARACDGVSASCRPGQASVQVRRLDDLRNGLDAPLRHSLAPFLSALPTHSLSTRLGLPVSGTGMARGFSEECVAGLRRRMRDRSASVGQLVRLVRSCPGCPITRRDGRRPSWPPATAGRAVRGDPDVADDRPADRLPETGLGLPAGALGAFPRRRRKPRPRPGWRASSPLRRGDSGRVEREGLNPVRRWTAQDLTPDTERTAHGR